MSPFSEHFKKNVTLFGTLFPFFVFFGSLRTQDIVFKEGKR